MREAVAIGFPGGTYNHLFYVADVDARGPAMNGELHAALDTSDFLADFPLKEDGCARLIGTVRADAEHHHEKIGRAGLRRNAVYLVRPDGYVALADPEARASAIASYFDARRLVPTKRELRSGG